MDERRGGWEHGVDENLASLNSGQRSQDEKLEKLESKQEETDATIHGETDSGLIGRIEDLETDVSRLNAVIFQDASGTKGLHHDILAVLGAREDRRDKWGNWTKIAVAIITSGTIGLFWRDIRAFLNRPVGQMMQKTKPPKRGKPHVHRRDVEPQPEAQNQSGVSVP